MLKSHFWAYEYKAPRYVKEWVVITCYNNEVTSGLAVFLNMETNEVFRMKHKGVDHVAMRRDDYR